MGLGMVPGAQSGFLEQQLARLAKNAKWTGVALAALAVAISASFPDYWRNLKDGPFKKTMSEVSAWDGDGLPPWRYVTMEQSEALKVGSATKGGSPVANFYVLSERSLGSETTGIPRLLLVRRKIGLEGGMVTGELKTLTTETYDKLINPLRGKSKTVRLDFLPFMLDETEDYWVFGAIIGGTSVCFMAFGIFFFYRASRFSAGLNSPVVKAIGRYGDVTRLVPEINQDLGLGSGARKYGSVLVGSRYLAAPQYSGCDVVKLDALLWAYKSVVRHSHNGIPTGKTYSAILLDRFGASTKVDGKEKVVDELLVEVSRLVPYAIHGYSDEIAAAVKAQPAALVAAVDKRKAEISAR